MREAIDVTTLSFEICVTVTYPLQKQRIVTKVLQKKSTKEFINVSVVCWNAMNISDDLLIKDDF